MKIDEMMEVEKRGDDGAVAGEIGGGGCHGDGRRGEN